MTQGDPTKRLNGLLKKLRGAYADATPPRPDPGETGDALAHELIFSLLLWEASTGQAKAALKRLVEAYIDHNELRVCMPDELAEVLGERYPLAYERSKRLKAVLMDVFRRQHGVTLSHLEPAGKREAKAYLEALDGMPPFAASRMVLVCLDGHALPVDERLRDLLADEGVLEEGTSPAAASSWLERHIEHGEVLRAYSLFQAWSDEAGHPPKRDRKAPSAELLEAGEPVKSARTPRPKSESAAKRGSKSKSRSGS